MIENKMPQTWFDTDYATTKALIVSKLTTSGPTPGAAAQSMLDNYSTYGTALTGTARTEMINFVNAEETNGNHATRDGHVILTTALGSGNNLVDYIRGSVVTNSGATFGVNGATFAGGEHIKTGYIPSAGINYALNDAVIGSFVKTVTITGASMFGCQEGSNLAQMAISPTRPAINVQVLNAAGNDPADDEQIISVRSAVNSQLVFQAGVQSGSVGGTSSAIPTIEMYIGSTNDDGVQIGPITGTLIDWFVGKQLANYSEFNTNSVTLFTALGAI